MQEKPEEHFVGLVAQKALIHRDKKVLMVKNLNSDRWDFPGGRLHLDELPIDGLMRELQEEIGCECEITSVQYLNQYFHAGAQKPCLFIIFNASLGEAAKIDIATDELSDYAWINPTTLSEEQTFQHCLDTFAVVVN